MKIRNGVISTVVCDEFLVIATREARPFCSSRYTQLNSSGRLVWESVERGEPIEEIISALQKRFPTVADKIAKDVRTFCASMMEKGFLCEDTNNDG